MSIGAIMGLPALPFAILGGAVLLLIVSLFFNPRAQMMAAILLLFAIATVVSL